MTLPAEVGNAPAIGKANLQAFVTPPGEMLVAPETLSDLNLAEGVTPPSNGGAALPPLRVQPQLVPGVLVVDIGVAQRLLKMPDQVSRLLIGKAKVAARAARHRRRRPAPPASSPTRKAISNA